MTTELLTKLWQINQTTVSGPIRKMTPDNYRNRLTPETASAGFIALHTAEAMHRFAHMLFGHEVTMQMQATGGISDTEAPLELSYVQSMVDDSFAMIANYIQQTSDEQWAEIIPTPFGETPRMGVLVFLMHHNSYHSGQIVQAVKKGKELTMASGQ